MKATPATPAKEILPGLFHFTQVHPNIGIDVDSYYLYDERVLIDPMIPGGGIEWFDRAGEGPADRHPAELPPPLAPQRRLRAEVRHQGLVRRAGHARVRRRREVESFAFGDQLPGGVTSIEVGALSPDEGSFLIPAHSSAAVLRRCRALQPDGPLGFVPDQFMDEPEQTKQGLIEAYRKLLELEFENLLLAHGGPVIGNGKDTLAQFVESGP